MDQDTAVTEGSPVPGRLAAWHRRPTWTHARRRRRRGTIAQIVAVTPASALASPSSNDDRVKRETTLFGAVQLVEEALAAAEESYRRVLTVFTSLLGSEHPEVAAAQRRLWMATRAQSREAEDEYHGRPDAQRRSPEWQGAGTRRPNGGVT